MVSIIICTYNREEVLCSTLRSVINRINADKVDAELIVVDQTLKHNDETVHFLKELSHEQKIRWIQLTTPSLPNARNVGIDAAKGRYLLFLDDDVELADTCLNAYIKAFENTKVDAVVGRVTLVNKDEKGNVLLLSKSPIKRFIKKVLSTFFSYKKSFKITSYGIILNNTNLNYYGIVDGGMGCNMAFRKEVFKKIGLFDVHYIGNALREETDIFMRLKRNKMKVLFEPQAHIFHIMYNQGGCRTEKNILYWENYFYNQTYFYLKNFGFGRIRIALLLMFDIFFCLRSNIPVGKILLGTYEKAQKLLK